MYFFILEHQNLFTLKTLSRPGFNTSGRYFHIFFLLCNDFLNLDFDSTLKTKLKMYLKHYLNEKGERVYTLKVSF